MTIAPSGNVGIGTATPGSTLDVAGDINFSGSVRFQGSRVLQVTGPVSANLALGLSALSSNTMGAGNTAMGTNALSSNTTGMSNTAIGDNALVANNTAIANTAVGAGALQLSTTGNGNTAIGTATLIKNTMGFNNTAIGTAALQSNTTGINNIAIGIGTAIGVTGSNSNNIHIGTRGASTDNATIRIGGASTLGDLGVPTSFFVAGVRGVTTAKNDAVPVVIDSAGQLGTVSSSRRYKEDIQDMGVASTGLMQLRPVTFRYQKPFADGSKPIQYGLIAEEVAEVYPDLVAHSADGQIETVKYQVLDSMLLNEVQRQQKEIVTLKDENQSLRQRLERLEAAMASARGAGVQYGNTSLTALQRLSVPVLRRRSARRERAVMLNAR